MKKILCILLTVLCLNGFSQTGPNQYPLPTGPAVLNGVNIWASGFGTSQIIMSASGILHVVMPGAGGVALEINGNTGGFDVQAYLFSSYQRGGVFGNTIGQYALITTAKSWFAQQPGTFTLNGPSAAYDGSSTFINKGPLKTDTVRVPGGSAGQALINDGHDNYIPTNLPSGVSGGGSFTSTLTVGTNTNAVAFTDADYIKSGNVISGRISGSVTPNVSVTGGTFNVTLPFAFTTGAAIGSITIYNGTGYTTGIVTSTSGSSASVSYSCASVGSLSSRGFVILFHYHTN